MTELTRREAFGHVARGAVTLGLGAVAWNLCSKSAKSNIWQLDPSRCVNSRLGAVGVEVCGRCAADCVLPLSAVRAVNDNERCGRCCICPAYFDIQSAVGPDGLPSRKLCPRDAITRTPIGDIDPDDPFNNYYEYEIDPVRCNGCGLCVMACKEPAGLGTMKLEVRYDLCVNCNRCSIAAACPDVAYERRSVDSVPSRGSEG